MKDMNFLYSFGLSVRKHRVVAGLNQVQLSEKIHCTRNTIGRIERGESDLKLSTLYQLAEGLDTTCSRLLKDAELPVTDLFSPSVEYDFLRLFQYCRRLTPKQFNNLCNTARLYAADNKS